MTPSEFLDGARALGYELSPAHLAALSRYRELLEDGNRKAALTRLSAPDIYWTRCALESLALVLALDGGGLARVVDVGSGAGIPAVPLAIAGPAHERWRGGPLVVAALEAVGKKAAFIEQVARELGLGHLEVLRMRAEEAGRDPELRESFDVATARAVADLSVLIELCLPLVRPGGLLVAFKGVQVEREVDAAREALAAVGGAFEGVVTAPLAGDDVRLVKVRKLGQTADRFPRRTGVPRQRPL